MREVAIVVTEKRIISMLVFFFFINVRMIEILI